MRSRRGRLGVSELGDVHPQGGGEVVDVAQLGLSAPVLEHREIGRRSSHLLAQLLQRQPGGLAQMAETATEGENIQGRHRQYVKTSRSFAQSGLAGQRQRNILTT